MAVIYLFDKNKKLKKPVKNVIEYIHREGEYTAEAQIRKKDEPAYGEFFGFMCADERFRLFLITIIDTDDETGVCTLTGIDAAVAELDGIVVERVAMQNVRAWDVIPPMLKNTGWGSRFAVWGETFSAEDLYYTTAWTVMQTVGLLSKVRFDPVYEFADGVITDKYVWVTERTNPFRGAIYTRKKGARNIQLTKEGRPYGRVYPIGKVVGDEEPPEQLTIAEAVWSVANGNHTDKPAGQTWIALPGATTTDAYVFEDKTETDPLRLMEKAFSDLQDRQKWHASGTANITDMSFARGYDYRPPTMWETVAIRTEDGETIETVITNIERYGVHKELTKIVVGEEETLEDQFQKLNRETVDAIKKAGGAGAGAGKAKRMILEAEELIQMNTERIEGNAREILLRATSLRVDQLENQTLVKFEETRLEMDETRGALSTVKQDVDNINNAVAGAVGEIETLAGEVALRAYNYTVDELGKRVRDNEAYIQLVPGLLEAKADLILLDGYVKAAQLETTNARISNLTSGLTKATVLDAALLKGDQANVTYLSANSFQLANNSMQIRTVSMGDVASVRAMVTGATSDVNLQHSHAIIYDESTGTFTLAEVSSSGGSFKVTDTQVYKNGVSAAKESVTISTSGWMGPGGTNTVQASNGKSLTVNLPPFNVTGGDSWNSQHKTTIFFTTPSVTGQPLKQVVVDASSVYTEGYAAGTAEGGVEDFKQGYEEGKAAWNPAYIERTSYSTGDKTVTVRAMNAKDVPLIWADIDASEIYAAGAEKVTLSSAGWIVGENVVTASNGKQLIVQLPSFSSEVGLWMSDNTATVNFYTPSVNVPLSQRVVDGSEVYARGKDSVSLSSDGWVNGVNTVEASNGKTFVVNLPDITLSNGDVWTDDYKTTVFASVPGVNLPVAQLVLDAGIIHQAGMASVTLVQDGWVGKNNQVTASNGVKTLVNLPPLHMTEGDWYTDNTKYIHLHMTNKNGESVSLDSKMVDASTVYTRGKNAVTLSAGGWLNGENTVTASNGKTVKVSLPEFSASGGTVWSDKKTTVSFSTPSVNVPLKQLVVDASTVYEDGYDQGWGDVTLSNQGWVGKQNVVKAANGQQATVLLPTLTMKQGEWLSDHSVVVTLIMKDKNGTETTLSTLKINAYAMYDAGWEAAKEATEVRGEVSSITNTAPNTFYATGYARALVGGEQVDSTTFYKTQTIKVGQ